MPKKLFKFGFDINATNNVQTENKMSHQIIKFWFSIIRCLESHFSRFIPKYSQNLLDINAGPMKKKNFLKYISTVQFKNIIANIFILQIKRNKN